MTRHLLISLLCLAGIAHSSRAEDVVRLKDGQSHRGEIVGETDAEIHLEISVGQLKARITLNKLEVAEVIRAAKPVPGRGPAADKPPSGNEQPTDNGPAAGPGPARTVAGFSAAAVAAGPWRMEVLSLAVSKDLQRAKWDDDSWGPPSEGAVLAVVRVNCKRLRDYTAEEEAAIRTHPEWRRVKDWPGVRGDKMFVARTFFTLVYVRGAGAQKTLVVSPCRAMIIEEGVHRSKQIDGQLLDLAEKDAVELTLMSEYHDEDAGPFLRFAPFDGQGFPSAARIRGAAQGALAVDYGRDEAIWDAMPPGLRGETFAAHKALGGGGLLGLVSLEADEDLGPRVTAAIANSPLWRSYARRMRVAGPAREARLWIKAEWKTVPGVDSLVRSVPKHRLAKYFRGKVYWQIRGRGKSLTFANYRTTYHDTSPMSRPEYLPNKLAVPASADPQTAAIMAARASYLESKWCPEDMARIVDLVALRAMAQEGKTFLRELGAAARRMDPVGQMAARHLGGLGPTAAPALPTLIARLKAEIKTEDGKYASTIGDAIAGIGPASVPHLVALLANKDGKLREVGARSLDTLCSADREARASKGYDPSKWLEKSRHLRLLVRKLLHHSDKTREQDYSVRANTKDALEELGALAVPIVRAASGKHARSVLEQLERRIGK